MTTLILGGVDDEHALYVLEQLQARGGDAELLDSRWFPSDLHVSFDPGRDRWTLRLPTGRILGPGQVRSVYWRCFNGIEPSELPDPEQAYFCEGLTDELITGLTRLNRFRVASRSAAMGPGEGGGAAGVGRLLNVDAVLEGSVRREAGRVRISVQLIHAPTDTHLWAQEFERDAHAAWPLQIEVAQAVAGTAPQPHAGSAAVRCTTPAAPAAHTTPAAPAAPAAPTIHDVGQARPAAPARGRRAPR